ncbi:TPA: hypothetical protein N2X54_002069 [Escherichia coli]|nr:hypothetical protein [Escherichia coli]
MQPDVQEIERFCVRVAQLHEALDALEQQARGIVAEFDDIASRLNALDTNIARIQDMYDDVQHKLK